MAEPHVGFLVYEFPSETQTFVVDAVEDAERLACAAANDWELRVDELERRLDEARSEAAREARERRGSASWPGC